MASKSIGLLNIVFGADLKGFDNAMKKAQKKLKKFGSSMTRIGGTMSASVTLPILAAAGASVKMASDMEESLNKVDVAFGDSSQQIKDFSDTTLEAFGIAKADALEMTSLFGDMGTSLGFTRAESADMSEALVGLAGDLSSFKNIDVATSQKALQGIFTGQTRTLQDLGVNITKNALENSKYFLSLNKNFSALTLQEKIMVRYNAVLEQTENATGDFVRTSGGFANQLRVLQGNFKDLGAELGSILLPTAVKIIGKIKEWIVKFRELGDGTKALIVKVALVAAAVGPVVVFFGKMSTGVAALIPIISSLGGAFRKLTLVMAANPFLAAAAAIVAIGVAIYSVIESANEFSDSMQAVNDVNLKAEKSIVSQKLAVEGLTSVLKDENASLEDKEKALAGLNEIAPDYYGKLTAAKTDVEALDLATQNYIATLRAEAKAMAAQEKMVEIEKKILDEVSKLKEQAIVGPMGMGTGVGKMAEGMLETVFTGSTGFEKTLKRIKDLEKQSEELGKTIKEIPRREPIIAPPDDAGDGGGRRRRGDGKKKKLNWDVELTPIIPKKISTGEYITTLFKSTAQLVPQEAFELFGAVEMEWENTTKTLEEQTAYTAKVLVEDFQNAADKIQKVMAALSGFFTAKNEKEQVEFDMWKETQEEKKSILDEQLEKHLERNEASNLNDSNKSQRALELEEEYAEKKAAIDDRIEKKEKAMKRKQAIRDKAMKIASAIMSTAEAVAANIAFPPLAALIGALGAIQVATIASTPIPFAQGGLVTGATLGLIGEGSGTSAFNPEVVSPLDKLMGMMGATEVDVHGRIEGNNIVLVSDKAQISRQRFI